MVKSESIVEIDKKVKEINDEYERRLEELRKLEDEVLCKVGEIINKFGGKIYGRGIIAKQPKGFRFIKINYDDIDVGRDRIYIPMIEITGGTFSLNNVRKLIKQMNEVSSCLSSLINVKGIRKLESQAKRLKEFYDEVVCSAIYLYREEWSKLPKEEVVWEGNGIRIVKVRKLRLKQVSSEEVDGEIFIRIEVPDKNFEVERPAYEFLKLAKDDNFMKEFLNEYARFVSIFGNIDVVGLVGVKIEKCLEDIKKEMEIYKLMKYD
jgi:hypothetical protein